MAAGVAWTEVAVVDTDVEAEFPSEEVMDGGLPSSLIGRLLKCESVSGVVAVATGSRANSINQNVHAITFADLSRKHQRRIVVLASHTVFLQRCTSCQAP